VIGWLGQISVAQGAFIAVGGAGAVITANTLHLPFPFPVLGAVVLSIPVSILIGLPALRLRGLHLVIATLAFGVAAQTAILPRFNATTRLHIPSYLTSDSAKYEVSLAFTALAFLLCWRISRTRVGRSFYALRDSETVASAYGIRPVRTKLTGFVVSGGIAALAGALLTYQLGSVNTLYASVGFSINWLSQSVVAGITSIAGPVIGALLFGLYPELSKSTVSASHISFVPAIVAGILTIVIMAINPEGLASMSRFVRSRVSAFGDDGGGDGGDLEAIEAATAAATHLGEPDPDMATVGR
jgi:branched-chain amino acid transport system permease protein